MKAGELCVAKDLWALVAHRRRIRATVRYLNPHDKPINGANHTEINAKSISSHFDSMLTLLLQYFDCLTSFFQIGKLDSDWDPLIANYISKVDTIAFNAMVGMNKRFESTGEVRSHGETFVFMRQLSQTNTPDCVFESNVQREQT